MICSDLVASTRNKLNVLLTLDCRDRRKLSNFKMKEGEDLISSKIESRLKVSLRLSCAC